MEKKIKIVIMIWLSLVTLCILFPPFTYTQFKTIYIPSGTQQTTIIRYGFLFSSPPEPKPFTITESSYGVVKSAQIERYDGLSEWRLILEIVAISFASLVVLLYVKSISKSNAENGKNENAG